MKRLGILTKHQFGFRQDCSTVDAILSLLNFVWDAVDDCKDSQALLCDLSRAFDCMNHEIFLAKLSHYGVRGVALRLMASYFEGRYQAVHSGGCESGLERISCGVAQGSLIGPLVFALFMNDLPANVPAHTIMYADDTTLVVSGEDRLRLSQQLDGAASRASSWFRSNQLSLNNAKTERIIFTCDRSGGDEPTSVRLLGIRMDTRLTWRPHTNELELHLSRAIYAIRRIRDIVGQDAALTAYHALFHSRMSYGIVVWGESSAAGRIFVLQKRAIRTVLAAPPGSHCRGIFASLGVLTMPGTYIFHQLVRARTELASLRTRGEMTSVNTRNRADIDIPRHRTVTSSMQHRHWCLFNALPPGCKYLPMVSFKREVRKILVRRPIYAVQEFLSPP